MIKGTMDVRDGRLGGGSGRGRHGCFQMRLLPIAALEINLANRCCSDQVQQEKIVNTVVNVETGTNCLKLNFDPTTGWWMDRHCL